MGNTLSHFKRVQISRENHEHSALLKQAEKVFWVAYKFQRVSKNTWYYGNSLPVSKAGLLMLIYSIPSPSHPISNPPEIWLRCVPSFPTSSAYTSVYQTFIIVHSVSCDSCLGLPGPRLSSLLLILFNMPESVLTRLTTSLHPASFQKWTNDSKLLFSICLSLVEVFFQSSNKYWMSTYYV